MSRVDLLGYLLRGGEEGKVERKIERYLELVTRSRPG